MTHAITHGLALVGDLFVDPGDRVLIPDMLWDNYALNFETRLGGVVETFPTYDGRELQRAGACARRCSPGRRSSSCC